MEKIVLPANEIPSFRTGKAIERGVEKRLLFTTWGGIGDQICAEPTLRFALDSFKDCEVFLETETPELYQHLKFAKVYDTKKVKPIRENFLVFETIPDPDRLSFEFVAHNVTHCVDFPCISALRAMPPISYKAVILKPEISEEKQQWLTQYTDSKYVAIHAGKHWQSKTFPVEYWNTVLDALIAEGFTPVLFGKETDETQGTVATKTEGCVDLREKTTLSESIWLLQRMKSMVTNDSSPMHMAATGNAAIAFIASAKHQDYLYHWRQGIEDQKKQSPQWAWKMKHFNKSGIWDIISNCPNQKDTVLIDKVDSEILKSWLPEPKEMIAWIKAQL